MTALRNRSFRRLWLAGLISDTGDWLLLVSLPILVYRYTGSALGTSIAFLVELVPPVALAPLAGSIADRFDRRRTLMLVSAAQAVALTPLLLVHGRAGLPVVYLVVIAQAALASVFDPAKSALLPMLVDSDQLVSANSLVGLNQNVGRLIGGSLGGLLLVVGGGLPTIVVADLISFLVAAALIAMLPRHEPPDPPEELDAHEPAPTGWSATLADHRVRGGLAVLAVASVAQGMFVVLSIVFVVHVLDGGSGEIGLLRGVQAIGAIAAGLALSATTRIRAGTCRMGRGQLRLARPRNLERPQPDPRRAAVCGPVHRSRRTRAGARGRTHHRGPAGHRPRPAREGVCGDGCIDGRRPGGRDPGRGRARRFGRRRHPAQHPRHAVPARRGDRRPLVANAPFGASVRERTALDNDMSKS